MRQRVLQAFKACHRARQTAFPGDQRALLAGREKINAEFRKNITETDPEKLEKLVRVAEDSAAMLQQCVVQAVKTDEGEAFEVRVRDSTLREKNHPYQDQQTGNAKS